MSWARLDDVSVGYGRSAVLHDVTLSIERGSLVALLGPSGCGKTTLVRAIAGHLGLTSGTISVGDRVLSTAQQSVRPEKRGVGWMPQDPSLFPHLSVRGNVGYGIRRRQDRAERVAYLLDLVGMTEFADRPAHALSGGQAQRVALARALAPEPAVVLLDEPFAALDPALRGSLREEVTTLLRDQGATAVLVTHDQEEALSLADTVAVMRNGRIVQTGSPRDLYEAPRDPWTAGFIGDVVELAGTIAGERVATALGVLSVGGTSAPPRTDSAVRVLLRPEWVQLGSAGTRVRVESVRYAGHDGLVTARTDGGVRVVARVQGAVLPRPGDEVGAQVVHPVLVYAAEPPSGLDSARTDVPGTAKPRLNDPAADTLAAGAQGAIVPHTPTPL